MPVARNRHSRQFHRGEKSGAIVRRTRFGASAAVEFRHLDACLFCERANRCREVDSVTSHDKEKTSPPMSQGQHFQVCLSWLTVIEGRRSLCQGQRATKFLPVGAVRSLRPITSTMSTAARTRSFRSKSVDRDKFQLRGARQVHSDRIPRSNAATLEQISVYILP